MQTIILILIGGALLMWATAIQIKNERKFKR